MTRETLKKKTEYEKCVKRNKRRTSPPSDDYFYDDESPDFLPPDQDCPAQMSYPHHQY